MSSFSLYNILNNHREDINIMKESFIKIAKNNLDKETITKFKSIITKTKNISTNLKEVVKEMRN